MINTDTKYWEKIGAIGTSRIIEARAQTRKSMDQGIPVSLALNGLEGQVYGLKVREGKVIV